MIDKSPIIGKKETYLLSMMEADMAEDNSAPIASAVMAPNAIFEQIAQSQQALQNAVLQLTHLQMASMKATYDALPTTEQKGAYCSSLKSSGYEVQAIASIVDRSSPTVYRQISESK